MELSRQLGPVAAPESLWDRIEQPQIPRREKPASWALWPIAAALLLMASGGAAWRIAIARDAGAGLARLAEDELRSGSLDFRSDDAAEIRSWVKAKTNIDIELPAGRSPVRLLGACVIRLKGIPVAAVAYRVGDDAAALLVMEKGSAAAPRHLFSHPESAGSARLISWSMRRQEYMIAVAGTKDPHGACLVCHVN
jgi:hypothetical protein